MFSRSRLIKCQTLLALPWLSICRLCIINHRQRNIFLKYKLQTKNIEKNISHSIVRTKWMNDWATHKSCIVLYRSKRGSAMHIMRTRKLSSKWRQRKIIKYVLTIHIWHSIDRWNATSLMNSWPLTNVMHRCMARVYAVWSCRIIIIIITYINWFYNSYFYAMFKFLRRAQYDFVFGLAKNILPKKKQKQKTK